MKRIIAITGGIGAGKSIVCRMLAALGYPVYDCDSEAKSLMDTSSEIRQRIADEVAQSAINNDGTINRKILSQCVFSDVSKLKKLNAIVHGAVALDIQQWVAQQKTAQLLFVETAILYESGFDKLIDEVWDVTCPADLRIERVMKRSNMTRHEVEQRINSQNNNPHPTHVVIINDDTHPLLPQIFSLLRYD